MNLDVERVWFATGHAKGGLQAEPAVEYLTRVNRDYVEGKMPERFVLGVFDSLTAALGYNRELKRIMRQKSGDGGQKTE